MEIVVCFSLYDVVCEVGVSFVIVDCVLYGCVGVCECIVECVNVVV